MRLASIVAIIAAAGVSGGLVNWAMNRPDGGDSRPWWSHVLTGIAAAFLVPLFLHVVSSDLLLKLLTAKSTSVALDGLVFAGFCLAASISSKAFIQTVSKRVLQMAEEAKKTAEAAINKSDKAVESAEAATFVSQAARDQASYLMPTAAAVPATITRGQVPEDPWAGQFGKSSSSNGRVLEARIRALPDTPGDWVAIRLTVRATDNNPLRDPVQFYLHDTFPNPTPTVPIGPDGTATLTIVAWGAFTVGALADAGKTKLELDLAAHPEAPEPFRSR